RQSPAARHPGNSGDLRAFGRFECPQTAPGRQHTPEIRTLLVGRTPSAATDDARPSRVPPALRAPIAIDLSEIHISPSLAWNVAGTAPAYEMKFLLDEPTARRVEEALHDRLAPD